MKRAFKGYMIAIGVFGSLAYAQGAWACDTTLDRQPASYLTTSSGSGLQLAAFGPNSNADKHSIVGMWEVNFTILNSDGQDVNMPGDFGYVHLHSDGTELMNSGGRAPATGNFCMGVWQQTGPRSYHIYHIALSYDATTGAQNAKVIIKEDVTLDAGGNSYSGSYTLDAGPPGGGAPFHQESGRIVGTRVTAQ